MRPQVFSTLTVSLAFLLACDGMMLDDEHYEHDLDTLDELEGWERDYALDTSPGLLPVHVASFDRVPTAEEIDEAYLLFLSADKDNSNVVWPTGPYWPAGGQKRVTLTAITGDIKNAGTDKANHVYFTGIWKTGSGQSYSEKFVLDAPNRDDLDRNRVDVFYYIVTLNNYVYGATSDQFIKGKIGNTSADGWFCDAMYVADMNSSGTGRTQALYYNQWVDSPYTPESSYQNGNNSSWLSY